MWLYGISAATTSFEASPSAPSLSGQAPGANQLLSSPMRGLNQGSKITDGIELIVDKKIKDMEERLMKRIDERLDRLEKRMEDDNSRIIALLSERKPIRATRTDDERV